MVRGSEPAGTCEAGRWAGPGATGMSDPAADFPGPLPHHSSHTMARQYINRK